MSEHQNGPFFKLRSGSAFGKGAAEISVVVVVVVVFSFHPPFARVIVYRFIEDRPPVRAQASLQKRAWKWEMYGIFEALGLARVYLSPKLSLFASESWLWNILPRKFPWLGITKGNCCRRSAEGRVPCRRHLLSNH